MCASHPIYIPNGSESQLERQRERGISQAGTSQPATEPQHWAVPPANEEGEAETARALLMIWDDCQKAQTIKSLQLLLHACRLNLLQLSHHFVSPPSPSGKREKLFLSGNKKPAMPPPSKTCQTPGSERSELLLFF